jgi:hypothetical protein
MMEREHDTRALDPVRDPARWEQLVGAIVTSARPELVRRRRSANLPDLVLQWARPALATAATVALLVSAAAVLRPGGVQTEVATASVAGAVVPERYAAWLVAGYEPTVAELMVALEDVP